jgi:hypothetical protein
VILVEGKYDEQFLTEAFKRIMPKKPVRVTCLEKLSDDSSTGGVDDLLRYVKANRQAIRARSNRTSVIVVLDWESSGKVEQFKKAVKDASHYKVFAWPETALNPKLGPDFRGIERALPERIIKAGMKRGASIEETKTGRYVVADKGKYGKVKQILAEIVGEGLILGDLTCARPFVEKLLDVAEADE